MLVGRVLQGLGAAGNRIVVMAIVRDSYSGRMMARVASFIMSIFILVPVIAPFIGQGILWIAEWHMIFVMFLVVSLTATTWFFLRQPETLPPDRRRAFSLATIIDGFRTAATDRITLGYTICGGMVFGSFQGYLVSAQPVFQGIYGVGDMFAVYFGIPALAIGVAGVINGRIVMKYGMRRLVRIALVTTIGLALAFGGYAYANGGVPTLLELEIYLILTFFCMGMLFGNVNALAMEPMGAIAGIAAAFVGAVSTMIAIPPAALVGHMFDQTILPMVGGFAVLGGLALAVGLWADREHPPGPIVEED
jgi:DHA1 family bicyclomycin/chloramphenicol resistance-like MFS transporter